MSHYTHIKLIKKSKTKNMSINSKPKVLSNTMFHIPGFWTTDIHCRTEWLCQLLGISIFFLTNLQCLLIQFDIYINERWKWIPCPNDSSKPNHVSTFLSLVNKDLPVKNIVFTTNIHYLWKTTDFEGII